MVNLSVIAGELYLRVDQEDDAGIPPLTKHGAFELTKGIFDIISQAICSGESVQIPKFGKFEVITQKARTGRNPHSGESIKIPAKLAVKFRVSSNLKSALKEIPVPKETAKKSDSSESKKKTKAKKKKK